MKRIEESELIRYLLGDLPEEDNVRIEQAYFADDEVFDHLLMLEDELSQQYALGKLSPRDAKLFESKFRQLPRFSDDVEFERSFAARSSSLTEAPQWWKTLIRDFWEMRPAFKISFAIALVAAFGIALQLWQVNKEKAHLLAERLSLKEDLAHKQSHSDSLAEQLRTEQVAREALGSDVAEREAKTKPPRLAFVLSPGLFRSESERLQTIRLPKADTIIVLQLDLEDVTTIEKYDAMLYNEQNEIVKSWNGVRSVGSSRSGLQLSLPLTSRSLKAESYRVELVGKKELVFSFGVVGR